MQLASQMFLMHGGLGCLYLDMLGYLVVAANFTDAVLSGSQFDGTVTETFSHVLDTQ